jgi:hypothetical protein
LDKNSFESKEQLSPLFERFFIGLRGFWQKKLQNLDSMSNLVQREEKGAVLSSILNQDEKCSLGFHAALLR